MKLCALPVTFQIFQTDKAVHAQTFAKSHAYGPLVYLFKTGFHRLSMHTEAQFWYLNYRLANELNSRFLLQISTPKRGVPAKRIFPLFPWSRLLSDSPPTARLRSGRWDWSKALNSLWTWSNHFPKMSCRLIVSLRKPSDISPEDRGLSLSLSPRCPLCGTPRSVMMKHMLSSPGLILHLKCI